MNEVERLLRLIWKDCEYGAGKRARLRAHQALQILCGEAEDKVITILGNELLHLKTFHNQPIRMWFYCMVYLPLVAWFKGDQK